MVLESDLRIITILEGGWVRLLELSLEVEWFIVVDRVIVEALELIMYAAVALSKLKSALVLTLFGSMAW